MICEDCLKDGKMVTCTLDLKHSQTGEICPRCERVWPLHPVPGDMHRHYASEKGYRDGIARMQREGRKISVSTRAWIHRKLKEGLS